MYLYLYLYLYLFIIILIFFHICICICVQVALCFHRLQSWISMVFCLIWYLDSYFYLYLYLHSYLYLYLWTGCILPQRTANQVFNILHAFNCPGLLDILIFTISSTFSLFHISFEIFLSDLWEEKARVNLFVYKTPAEL